MKAADFIYHRAQTLEQAIRYLEDYDGNARILAGGQSLMPMLSMRLWRPSALIDINAVASLASVEACGDETVVGALVRYVTIETAPVFAQRLPLLAAMVHFVGDRQVRNRGTIGGSLVQGDPSAEMPLACLVLGARVRVVGPRGPRMIAMAAFYEGSYAATIEPDEVVQAIVFPRHPSCFAFEEVTRRHNDFAVLSIAATAERSGDGCWHDIRLGLGGVHDTPILVPDVGVLLEGSRLSDDDIAAAGEAAGRAAAPQDDMRASEDYRRHLVAVHVPRLLRTLRASGCQ